MKLPSSKIVTFAHEIRLVSTQAFCIFVRPSEHGLLYTFFSSVLHYCYLSDCVIPLRLWVKAMQTVFNVTLYDISGLQMFVKAQGKLGF